MLRLAAGAVVLDRYQIITAPTYTDARGLVAPAFDPHLGRRVDLMLAPEPVGTPVGDRFARRAGVVALLRHEALPLVMDMGRHQGHIVLAYRPAEGRSLADSAAQDTAAWSMRRVLETIASLAAALGLAHAHGLCHGSFSTRSVLIEPDGTAVIPDLAWPRPATALDPDELAPEVRRGAALTPRSDVFALGQMVRTLMRLTDSEAEPALRGVARQVARQATARAPRERYADGAVMGGRSRACWSSLARRGRSPPLHGQERRSGRRPQLRRAWRRAGRRLSRPRPAIAARRSGARRPSPRPWPSAWRLGCYRSRVSSRTTHSIGRSSASRGAAVVTNGARTGAPGDRASRLRGRNGAHATPISPGRRVLKAVGRRQ